MKDQAVALAGNLREKILLLTMVGIRRGMFDFSKGVV